MPYNPASLQKAGRITPNFKKPKPVRFLKLNVFKINYIKNKRINKNTFLN